MQLLRLKHILADELQRRTMMYARLEDVIRAGSFSLEDYDRFCREAKELWPITVYTEEWQYLLSYLPQKHPFLDTYFAVYELQTLSKEQAHGSIVLTNNPYCNATVWKEIHTTNMGKFKNMKGTTIIGRGKELGIMPFVLFFETDDDVRRYYHQVLHIEFIAYHIMEAFYQRFQKFSQHNVNQFAIKEQDRCTNFWSTSNSLCYVPRHTISETEEEINILEGKGATPKVEMNPILTLCFKELGNAVKEMSTWRSKETASSYLSV